MSSHNPMSKLSRQVNHKCQLREDFRWGDLKIHPNSSLLQKVWHWCRKQTLMNPRDKTSELFFKNISAALAERRRQIRRGQFVIHPLSNLNQWKLRIVCLAWLGTFITSPLHAFHTKRPRVHCPIFYTLFYIQFLLELVIWANCLLTFVTGYTISNTKEIVLDRKRIAKRYLKTFFFVDLFGYIHMQRWMSMAFPDISDFKLELLSLIGTVKYFRLISIHVFVRNVWYDMNAKVLLSLFYVALTLVTLHLLTCLSYKIPNTYNLYLGKVVKSSWIYRAKIGTGYDCTLFSKYVKCLHCVTCHFFGAGSGSCVLRNFLDHVMFSLVLIFGRLYTLMMAADLLNSIGVGNLSESRFEELQSQLRRFTMSKLLPKLLQDRILEFYEYKYQKHYFNARQIEGSLSTALKDEIAYHNSRSLLERGRLFKALPRQIVAQVFSNLQVEYFLTNDVVHYYNDPVDNLYFISYGGVAIYNPLGHELLHLHDGDDFGMVSLKQEKSLFLYSVVATETSELFSIEKEKFLELTKQSSEFSKFYQNTVREKSLLIDSIERYTFDRNDDTRDILAELRAGRILEHRRKRGRHVDV